MLARAKLLHGSYLNTYNSIGKDLQDLTMSDHLIVRGAISSHEVGDRSGQGNVGNHLNCKPGDRFPTGSIQGAQLQRVSGA